MHREGSVGCERSGGRASGRRHSHRYEGDGSHGDAREHGGDVPDHYFGTGLADDRYVVERFKARVGGNIVPAPAEAPAAKGRRKVKRTTVKLKAVKELRPVTTEIINCTGLKTRGGIQVWGSIAVWVLCDRKQKG